MAVAEPPQQGHVPAVPARWRLRPADAPGSVSVRRRPPFREPVPGRDWRPADEAALLLAPLPPLPGFVLCSGGRRPLGNTSRV